MLEVGLVRLTRTETVMGEMDPKIAVLLVWVEIGEREVELIEDDGDDDTN